MERFHRPVRMPLNAFDEYVGAPDPAAVNRVAHDTAQALLHRVSTSEDPTVVERTVEYANANGLDDLVQLWAPALPHTLPGSLWRLYLVHAAVSQHPTLASYLYRRGVAVDRSINHIVAGAPTPTGPEEVRSLTEQILRGAFTGDFADALSRAAAFCAVMSLGCADLAESDTETSEARASVLLRRGARYLDFAHDLAASARLWREGRLE